MSMITKNEIKHLMCDNCSRTEKVEQALKERWTYSQSGHMCCDCTFETIDELVAMT